MAVDLGIAVSFSAPDLTGATVTINNYQSGDTLSFTTQNGISGTYSSGMLTLSGVATASQYQAVLQSVTFFSTSLNTTTRSLSIIAVDGSLDSNAAPEQVNVVAPVIGVTGNGQSIVDGSATTSAANDTAFGSTLLGTSLSETYTITNSGTAALTLGTVSIGGANAGDFTVTSQPAGSVAAGGSTTFTVQFAPTAGGTRNATVSFTENDPTTQQSVHLRHQRRGHDHADH